MKTSIRAQGLEMSLMGTKKKKKNLVSIAPGVYLPTFYTNPWTVTECLVLNKQYVYASTLHNIIVRSVAT